MNRVLVVDDEPDVQDSVRAVLEKFSFDVACVEDAAAARTRLTTFDPHLIILDIMLPGTSGKDFCRELRQSRDVPVIFLSGLDSQVDRIVGLELGADDYLTKPFHPGELLARVRAVLRRAGGANAKAANGNSPGKDDAMYTHGPVKVDLDRYLAFVSDHELDLTKTELLLLKTLMRRPTRVYSRDELAEGAYGPGTYVSPRTINSHIRRIRQKFEDYGVDPIVTVRGVGYRMSRFNGDEEE